MLKSRGTQRVGSLLLDAMARLKRFGELLTGNRLCVVIANACVSRAYSPTLTKTDREKSLVQPNSSCTWNIHAGGCGSHGRPESQTNREFRNVVA